MAMVVSIDLLTGATPTVTPVSSKVFNRQDSQSGLVPIPTPTTTGANFSYVASFQIEIVTANGLIMSDIKFGKLTNESVTGTRLWVSTAHSAYTQAVAPPNPTADNNVTAPTINGATGVAVPLIGAASVYAAGPFTVAGRVGNIVEVVAGIDFSNFSSGSGVALPTLEFQYVES